MILTFFSSDYLDLTEIKMEEQLRPGKDLVYIWTFILMITYLIYCWNLNVV